VSDVRGFFAHMGITRETGFGLERQIKFFGSFGSSWTLGEKIPSLSQGGEKDGFVKQIACVCRIYCWNGAEIISCDPHVGLLMKGAAVRCRA
jgi:hypothetical protein